MDAKAKALVARGWVVNSKGVARWKKVFNDFDRQVLRNHPAFRAPAFLTFCETSGLAKFLLERIYGRKALQDSQPSPEALNKPPPFLACMNEEWRGRWPIAISWLKGQITGMFERLDASSISEYYSRAVVSWKFLNFMRHDFELRHGPDHEKEGGFLVASAIKQIYEAKVKNKSHH